MVTLTHIFFGHVGFNVVFVLLQGYKVHPSRTQLRIAMLATIQLVAKPEICIHGENECVKELPALIHILPFVWQIDTFMGTCPTKNCALTWLGIVQPLGIMGAT